MHGKYQNIVVFEYAVIQLLGPKYSAIIELGMQKNSFILKRFI